MFRKILLTVFIISCSSNVFAQQMVGNSMGRFMNFANNGGRLTTHNQVQYQHQTIYNSVYDADRSEYRGIQKERRTAVMVLQWLGVDPQQTPYFSYYKNQEKTKN